MVLGKTNKKHSVEIELGFDVVITLTDGMRSITSFSKIFCLAEHSKVPFKTHLTLVARTTLDFTLFISSNVCILIFFNHKTFVFPKFDSHGVLLEAKFVDLKLS